MIDGVTLRIIFAVVAFQVFTSCWFFYSRNRELQGIKCYTISAFCFFLMFTVLSLFSVTLQLWGSLLNNIFFVLFNYFFVRAFIELLEIRTSNKAEKTWLFVSLIAISIMTLIDLNPRLRIPIGEAFVSMPPVLYLLYLLRFRLRTPNHPREISYTNYSLLIIFGAHLIYLNAFTFSSNNIDLLNNQIKNIGHIGIVFGHLSLTIAFLMLISGLKQARILTMANIDPLTGVLNRRAFYSQMEGLAELESEKYIMMVDADHFKEINDTYGHQAGDKALIHIAKSIKTNISKNDMIARYGGEEFVVLIAGCNKQDATSVAERIRSSLAKNPVSYKKHNINFTVSIGLAPYSGNSLQEDINRADSLLYKAKESGRNKVCVE